MEHKRGLPHGLFARRDALKEAFVMVDEISRELTGAEILAADDRVQERVDTPEWKGHVFIRNLSGKERDAWETSMVERKTTRGKQTSEVSLANVRASLVARTAVSSSGVRLFTDTQVVALGEKSAAALNRCYEMATKLSGLRDEDVEELAADFSVETVEPSTSV
jgi:hypothetical protein